MALYKLGIPLRHYHNLHKTSLTTHDVALLHFSIEIFSTVLHMLLYALRFAKCGAINQIELLLVKQMIFLFSLLFSNHVTLTPTLTSCLVFGAIIITDIFQIIFILIYFSSPLLALTQYNYRPESNDKNIFYLFARLCFQGKYLYFHIQSK